MVPPTRSLATFPTEARAQHLAGILLRQDIGADVVPEGDAFTVRVAPGRLPAAEIIRDGHAAGLAAHRRGPHVTPLWLTLTKAAALAMLATGVYTVYRVVAHPELGTPAVALPTGVGLFVAGVVLWAAAFFALDRPGSS